MNSLLKANLENENFDLSLFLIEMVNLLTITTALSRKLRTARMLT